MKIKIRNLIQTVKTALSKGGRKAEKKLLALTALCGIAPTFCVDVDSTGQNVIKAVFNILLLGGTILTAVGIVQLVRAIMEASQGQSQPGAVGKALGMILGGVVMMASKAVVEAIAGPIGNWSLTA
ncbi:MAG: hypothetical protein IJT16_04510 [Lachnospiraceae bacterium]|nr:hypothetical protein [Lachnospiraceae bacterium]